MPSLLLTLAVGATPGLVGDWTWNDVRTVEGVDLAQVGLVSRFSSPEARWPSRAMV